jgi:hypothetical protein
MPKINGEAFDALKASLERLDTERVREAYRAGKFPRSEMVKDLDKRYRWDCFYATDRETRFMISDLAGSDAVIYTALSKIIPPLK